MAKTKRPESIEAYLALRPTEAPTSCRQIVDNSVKPGTKKPPYKFKRVGNYGWVVDEKDQRVEMLNQLDLQKEDND